jgi:hypothetical protein
MPLCSLVGGQNSFRGKMPQYPAHRTTQWFKPEDNAKKNISSRGKGLIILE